MSNFLNNVNGANGVRIVKLETRAFKDINAFPKLSGGLLDKFGYLSLELKALCVLASSHYSKGLQVPPVDNNRLEAMAYDEIVNILEASHPAMVVIGEEIQDLVTAMVMEFLISQSLPFDY